MSALANGARGCHDRPMIEGGAPGGPGAARPRAARVLAGVLGALLGALALLAGGPVPAAAQAGPSTTVPVQAIDPTSTAADNPAQRTLLFIIGGLVLLGIVVLVCTVVFWRRTRPGLADEQAAAAAVPPPTRVSAADLVRSGAPDRVPVVPAASPDDLRSVPLWADEAEPEPQSGGAERSGGRR